MTSFEQPGQSVRFAYDANGNRTSKTETTGVQGAQGVVTETSKIDSRTLLGLAFVYDEQGNLLGSYSNGSSSAADEQMEVIWLPLEGGTSIPVGVVKGGQLYAVHSDHLGTPRYITDGSNTLVWQWPYSAFGENAPLGVYKAKAGRSGTELIATQPQLEFQLRFPGQYCDKESPLCYNGFRYYWPIKGRYPQADLIGLGAGWNRYGYVGSNPLARVDHFGLADFPVQFDAGSGTLWITPPGATAAQGFPAGNNTTTTSRGPWSSGTFEYAYSTTHLDDGPNSAYGSSGNAVFKVPGCTGCGVHSGRETSKDLRGGTGVNHVTEGCIRTTDDATKLIRDLIVQGNKPVLQVSR